MIGSLWNSEGMLPHAGMTPKPSWYDPNAKHVGYKGELPILPDLIAGRLEAGVISTALALQYGFDITIAVWRAAAT